MKKILSVLLTIVVATAYSQDGVKEIKTLFAKDNVYGGFGTIEAKVSPLGKNTGVFTGLRGGVLINHRLAIGAASYNLSMLNPEHGLDAGWTDSSNFSMNYNGLYLEYILMPDKPVHISFPLVIGMGSVKEESNTQNEWTWNFGENVEPNPVDWDYKNATVVVIEPAVNIEFSLLKHVRLGVGAGYRYVFGDDFISGSNSVLSDFSVSANLKFGAF